MEDKEDAVRLISLNTWAGRALYPLMNFLKKHSETTDIFCLQEVHNANQATMDTRHPDEHMYGPLFDKIGANLKGFEGSFAYFDDDADRMSLAIFWRQGLLVKKVEDILIYKPAEPKEKGSKVFSSRKLQYLVLDLPQGEYLVAHYHGLWNGGPKTDTPERIIQSEKLHDFLNNFNGPKIICGDFNLLPDTESMRILEKGMKNLVKEKQIKSTRTILYRHYDDPAEPNFADYVLVSSEINVRDFAVLPDIASDHSPLLLDFS